MLLSMMGVGVTGAAATNLSIVSSGEFLANGSDNLSWTGSSVSIPSGGILCIVLFPRKTVNSDTDITIASLTHNSNAMTVSLNQRQSGSSKQAVILAYTTTAGTGTIGVDLTGSAVNMEAIHGYYWVLQNQNGTPIADTDFDIQTVSTNIGSTLTFTVPANNCYLIGGWAVTDAAYSASIIQGTLDGTGSAGTSTQGISTIYARRLVNSGTSSIEASWSTNPALGIGAGFCIR